MATISRPREKPAVVSALRRHLARGGTFREAEILLKRPHRTLYDVAQRHRIKHRRRGLPANKRRKLLALLKLGEKPYRAALKTPVSTRTAWAYAHLQGLRTLQQRASTPRPCRPWRCPIGGELLKLTICIAHGCRKTPKVSRPHK